MIRTRATPTAILHNIFVKARAKLHIRRYNANDGWSARPKRHYSRYRYKVSDVVNYEWSHALSDLARTI